MYKITPFALRRLMALMLREEPNSTHILLIPVEGIVALSRRFHHQPGSYSVSLVITLPRRFRG
jgi:hypothetical protein